MITLAFNQMLYYLFVSVDTYGGDEGLQIMAPLTVAGYPIGGDRTTVYYVCLATLALVLVGGVRLVSSRFGMVIRAASGNERRVAAVGIAPRRIDWSHSCITGAVAGLAGVLLATVAAVHQPGRHGLVALGRIDHHGRAGRHGARLGPGARAR